MGIVIVVECEANLFEIIAALGPSSSFPSLLNGWQDQSNKYADDRNYYQQFNQRECTSEGTWPGRSLIGLCGKISHSSML